MQFYFLLTDQIKYNKQFHNVYLYLSVINKTAHLVSICIVFYRPRKHIFQHLLSVILSKGYKRKQNYIL